AQSSCDVLHVELGGASLNVLGLNLALNPIPFDIATANQSPAATPSTPSTTPRTVTTSPSANATQPAASLSPTPGVVATPKTTARPAAAPTAQTPLGSLLCSVERFRDVSSPAQLVQQLNAILSALTMPQGA